LHRRSKSGNNDDILGLKIGKRNQRSAVGLHEELNASLLQIFVHVRIVNHLAQQEDPLSFIFVDGSVGLFNGMFDAVAEPEMPGYLEPQAFQLKYGRCEILAIPVLSPSGPL